MSTITLPNIRVSSDLEIRLKLKDGGVAIDWSTLTNIKASIYSDRQRSLAGRCDIEIDEDDNTILVCRYSANKPQYPGVNRVIVCCTYDGETKTYDKPAFTFVRWTDDQAGQSITIDDPDIDVEITVEDISSSILQEAVEAAFSAAERADEAAAAAEHMVDIHQGPAGPAGADGSDGKSAYEIAVEEGFEGTEPEWLASLVGPQGPQGIQGIQGEQGEQGPQGVQGNTGSSVDYPFELVNNEDTDDATKAHTAAGAKRLKDEITQLEHIVTNLAGKFYGVFGNYEELPEGDIVGYAFVGLREPLNLFVFDGEDWTDTEILISGITGPQGPQGEPGEQGIQGPPGVTSAVASVDNGTGVPSVETSLNGGVLTLIFHNLKGAQGDTGSSVDYAYTLVNNLVTNDSTKGLSAAMGKYLQDEIEGMNIDITDADLDIADGAGNILVRFKDGEIETKNFNSEGVNDKLDTIEEGAEVNDVDTAEADNGDYAVADENGKILVLFKDGHIKTKNFDSQKVGRRIRILAIGNSWTCDAFNYLGVVFNDVLGETADLHIGVCYEGGASLQTHYTNLVNNNTYTFYEWVNDGPSWGKSTKNINTILTLDDWDVIMFQQVSTDADDYSTYQPYLNDCMDLISERVNSPVKFGWNLVRRTMTTEVDWDDISDNAQRLLRETLIQFIVPTGTATENARTTSLDSLGADGHLTYDGSHLQEGLPCLVETYASALYFLSLFGLGQKGINGSTFRPIQTWIDAHGMDGQANGPSVGVTDANVVLAKKCATIAVNNPYVITDCSNL